LNLLSLHIESLIFVANPSISFDDIKSALEEALATPFDDTEINVCIEEIRLKYGQDEFAFELVEVSGGLRFMTKAVYHHTIGIHLRQNTHKKLSKSALETLAIVAYKQPTSKSEIEAIRGVNCDYTMQKLLEKDLVEITGRSDGPGKPLLYGTTQKFMDYFGIKTLDDLPKLKEIMPIENQIGEQAPLEDTADLIEEIPQNSEIITTEEE
jgi:segregation and condensation protein B